MVSANPRSPTVLFARVMERSVWVEPVSVISVERARYRVCLIWGRVPEVSNARVGGASGPTRTSDVRMGTVIHA